MSRGPDGAKREAWWRRLGSFERGTAKVADFCRREGVSVASFYQWRRKLDAVEPASVPSRGPRASRRSARQVGFVPVEITVPSPAAATGPSCVEILFPSGARLLVPCHAREALRTVVATLTSERGEKPPC